MRLRNRAAKVLAGLPLGGEAVWPGEPSDLFVAHASIYTFASSLSPAGGRCLDVACGTGYGSAILARTAGHVLGADRDPRHIRFARRRFAREHLEFHVADCEDLHLPLEGKLDFVVCSNTLEHLRRPAALLERLQGMMSAEGRILIAVPPVFSTVEQRLHDAHRFHRSNLSIREWGELFRDLGWTVAPVAHSYPGTLDFSSPFPSRAAIEDFDFRQASIDELYSESTITAVFLLRQRGV